MPRLPPHWTGPSWVAAGAASVSFAAVFVMWSDLGPTGTAFYRFLIAGVILGAYVGVVRPQWQADASGWRIAIAAGAIFGIDMAIWNRAIPLVGPGMATLVANLQVLIVPVLARVGFGAPIPRGFIWPSLVCVVGVALFSAPGEGGAEEGRLAGVAWCLAAACCYATYITLMKAAASKIQGHSSVTLLVVCVSAATVLGPVTAMLGEPMTVPGTDTWGALLGMALVCQIAGWAFVLRGMKTTSAAVAAIVLVSQPVLATVWDVLFFGRQLTLLEFAGAALTLGGIIWGARKATASR